MFLDFPIVSAKRVTTPEGDESQLDLADATRGGIPYADVARCFDELTGYAIRAQGAFTVLGSRTGYPHRVVVDETDVDATTRLCIVDESLPATRTGRAIPGQLFDNAIVRFHLEDTDLARLDTVQLSFQVAQTPAELVISIGNELPTVLSDVAYNPVDGNVYVVDTSFAGLVQLTLDPVRTGVSFE